MFSLIPQVEMWWLRKSISIKKKAHFFGLQNNHAAISAFMANLSNERTEGSIHPALVDRRHIFKALRHCCPFVKSKGGGDCSEMGIIRMHPGLEK